MKEWISWKYEMALYNKWKVLGGVVFVLLIGGLTIHFLGNSKDSNKPVSDPIPDVVQKTGTINISRACFKHGKTGVIVSKQELSGKTVTVITCKDGVTVNTQGIVTSK